MDPSATPGPTPSPSGASSSGTVPAEVSAPTPAQVRRWRQYLADERAEAAVYRDLAVRRSGEERAVLLALADAEGRHEAHWLKLLGHHVGMPLRGSLRTRLLGLLARRFGSVFVLALAQRAEGRSPYGADDHASPAMAADETIHEEVVRALAMRGRNRLSGTFRAAVFGANDGLVSNLALVLGISASGVSNQTVLLTGLTGLLAGALSMGAGEYVSVRSQRELLEASTPDPRSQGALPHLDLDANELTLVYRARGMSEVEADVQAARVLATQDWATSEPATAPSAGGGAGGAGEDATDEHEAVGTGAGAAVSSFCFFASGAIIPVLPYLLGLEGVAAVLVSAVLVGLALLVTGATVGLLAGGPPVARALRQLAIGYGAAGATYALGLLFGTGAA